MQKKQQGRPFSTKLEKIVNNKIYFCKNTELLTLTYGAIVSQIVKDSENILDANEQLEKLGQNIGARLIDEFLAKGEIKACRSVQEVADNIAKQAFPMFLGVNAEIEREPQNLQDKIQFFNIHIADHPLIDFVELPEHLNGLDYSIIIGGAISGALRAIHWIATCRTIKDQLKGDEKTTIQVEICRQKFKEDD